MYPPEQALTEGRGRTSVFSALDAHVMTAMLPQRKGEKNKDMCVFKREGDTTLPFSFFLSFSRRLDVIRTIFPPPSFSCGKREKEWAEGG